MIFKFIVLAILISSTGANASLVERLEGDVIYDDATNLSWIANANLASNNTFGLQTGVNLGSHPSDSRNNGFSTINANGTMTWVGALHWVDAMNTANYLGFNDWRLAETVQPDAACSSQNGVVSFGFNCTGSDMGYLYNIDGVTSAAPNLFSNLQAGPYWSGAEYEVFIDDAWFFNFNDGLQGVTNKGNGYYAIAVRSGDVIPAPVPIPFITWIIGASLLCLFGMRRLRKY